MKERIIPKQSRVIRGLGQFMGELVALEEEGIKTQVLQDKTLEAMRKQTEAEKKKRKPL